MHVDEKRIRLIAIGAISTVFPGTSFTPGAFAQVFSEASRETQFFNGILLCDTLLTRVVMLVINLPCTKYQIESDSQDSLILCNISTEERG